MANPANSSNQTHKKLASFGKKFLWTALIVGVIWFGIAIWSKNQPAKPQPTQQQSVARQQATKQNKKQVFTLNPGQGKVIVTNYKRVGWKTTGPAMVRERDQAWYGKWKKDLPDQDTNIDERASHAVEFWVPRNFPGPVTIVFEQA